MKRRARRIRVEVKINPDAWAQTYGFDPEDLAGIQEDAQTWAYNLLTEAARQSEVLAED